MTVRKGGLGRRPGRRRACRQKKVSATSARRSKGGNAEGHVATVAASDANVAAPRRARPTDASGNNEGGKKSTAKRYVRQEGKSGDRTTTTDDGDDEMHFTYHRIDDAQARRYSYPSHVLETLTGERGSGLIERYHVYERRLCGEQHPPGPAATASSDAPASRTRGRERRREEEEVEVVVGDVRFGDILDGHPGVVHGGVTSLVFDDLMGHACDVLLAVGNGRESEMTTTTTDTSTTTSMTTCVTANLSVNFRSPMPSGSEVVVRVYHELGKSRGRKIHLRATMSSYDGDVLYSDATSLYIKVEAAIVNGVDSEAMTTTSASEDTLVSMNKDDAGTTTTGTSLSGDMTTETSLSGDIFM